MLPCWVARWFCPARHMPEAVAVAAVAVAFTAAVASMPAAVVSMAAVVGCKAAVVACKAAAVACRAAVVLRFGSRTSSVMPRACASECMMRVHSSVSGSPSMPARVLSPELRGPSAAAAS